MREHTLPLVSGVLAAVFAASGCSSDVVTDAGAADTASSPRSVPMVVDYSPTLSDVPALMFLATHPDVELLAVTLPGTGESDCAPGVRNTRALLEIAGHPDVPVACGPETPMEGDRDWPLSFREASRNLRGAILPLIDDVDPIEAIDLLADTLRSAAEPVTIVTLGPLTNLGYAFDADPTLANEVRSIVTMGGAFDVPGNVFDAGEIVGASPDAEWNLYIDPESVRVVLNSGAPVTFVPLDATNFVPGNIGIFARLSATVATDSGEAVRQLWASSLGTERSIASEWWYFWDELAAVIAVDPSVATLSERLVTIEESGVTAERDDGVPALVASAADPERFEQRFLETFAGGELPVAQLTDHEDRYLEVTRAAMLELGTSVDEAFAGVEERAGRVPADELAAQLVGDVFDRMDEFNDALSGTEAPDRLRAQHEAMVEATTSIIDTADAHLEALERAAPSQPLGADGFFEMFFEATETAGLASPFDAFETACGDLEFVAYGLGAVQPTCLMR